NFFNANLPKDCRTFLKTPTQIGKQIVQIGGERHLSLQLADLRAPRAISLNLNMDNLPIYASGRKQFWPILGKIHEEPKWRPFAIGFFYGHSMPKRVEEYLEHLVKELRITYFRTGNNDKWISCHRDDKGHNLRFAG
uniref:Uncharacterized protein n=1 Tax=Anopheles albimanus TaxID=7167 RepID=A0A182F478_ANOAL